MDKQYIETIEIDDNEIEIIEIEDETPLNDLKKYNKTNNIIENIRKKLTKTTAAIITVGALTLLITISSVFVLNKSLNQNTFKKQENVVYANINDNIEFKLNNPEYNTINVNEEYKELGAQILVDGIDKSNEIKIDSSDLNTKKPGTYHVIYTYTINMNQIKTLYRTINVVDTEAPILKLLGENVYTMLVNDTYQEPGIIVTDNSNEDLLDKVQIENNINSNIPGTYQVKYTVRDSSGNETIKYRTVQVKRTYANNTNSITYNNFTENGIFIKGTVQDYSFKNQMLLKNKNTGNELIIDTTKLSSHYYQLSLDVQNMENGSYEFYLVNNTLEPLTNNMNNYNTQEKNL